MTQATGGTSWKTKAISSSSKAANRQPTPTAPDTDKGLLRVGDKRDPGSALPAGLQETSKKAVSGPCSYTLSRRDREGLEPGCIIT